MYQIIIIIITLLLLSSHIMKNKIANIIQKLQNQSITKLQQSQPNIPFKKPYRSIIISIGILYINSVQLYVLKFNPFVVLIVSLPIILTLAIIYQIYQLSTPLQKNLNYQTLEFSFASQHIFQRQGTIIEIKKCLECNIYKTIRINHCKSCDRCFSWHDHHCQWLGCCIMANNYQYFILFLTFLSGMMLCWIGYDIWIIKELANHYNSSQKDRLLFGISVVGLIQVSVVGIYSFQLLIFHIWLIYNGISTREYYHSFIRRENRFSQRLSHNYGNVNQLDCQQLNDSLTNSRVKCKLGKNDLIFDDESQGKTQLSMWENKGLQRIQMREQQEYKEQMSEQSKYKQSVEQKETYLVKVKSNCIQVSQQI